MEKGNFKQAIKVDGNINGIFKLPCVHGVFKGNQGEPLFRVTLDTHSKRGVAVMGDWLCQDHDGNWHVVNGNDYDQLVSRNASSEKL